MAIASVHEIWEAEEGEQTLGGYGTEGITRTYQRQFRVITDDPEDDQRMVLDANGIPAVGDSYRSAGNERDADVMCVKVEAKSIDPGRLVWEVTASYDSAEYKATELPKELGRDRSAPAAGKSKDAKQQGNPTERPPKVAVTFQRWVRPVQKDFFETRIQNSADEPFDPPVEKDDLRKVLRITQHVKEFDPADDQNRGVVNSRAFQGFRAGALRQVGIEAEEFWENGERFWEVTREFLEAPPDNANGQWNPTEILDYGYYQIIDGKRKLILAEIGDDPREGTFHPISRPAPLNGNGQVARNGIAEKLHFWFYPTLDFEVFGIGNVNR